MPRLSFNGHTIELATGQSVLDGLLDQGHSVAHSCRAGACQACLLQATAGEVPSQAQSGLKPTLVSQGYFLACQCQPLDDLAIRQPDADEHRQSATVSDLRPLSDEVMALSLVPDGPFDYRPGQYTTLWRNDRLGRSYSLASVPALDEALQFHIRRVPDGRFSGWVFDQLRPGDRIDLQTAAGDCFYLPGQPDADLLLVGTATGLAPLYGILRDALQQGHRGSIHLLHGAFDSNGLYLRDELQRLADSHHQVHYHTAVLQPGGPDDAAGIGRIDNHALDTLPSLNNPTAFLCGAPDFVRDLRKRLFLAGMPMSRIHADAFLPAAANNTSSS